MNVSRTAPHAPVAQPPDVIEQQRSLLEATIWGVVANTVRALAAGFGVGLVMACALWWLGAKPETVAVWSLRTWGIVGGVLLFVLHTDDRIRAARWQWTAHERLASLDDAEDEIERLLAENAERNAENARLRWDIARLKDNRNYMPAVDMRSAAYVDAQRLIRQWGATGAHPSRRSSGLTDAAHRAAMDILQMRRIIDRPTPNSVTWLAPNESAALAMLSGSQEFVPDDDE